jgi:glycosyltransferase involved in cell wall biosynthesis
VYLTGEYSDEVVEGSASDEVVFLGFKSSEVSGLKLKAIAKIKQIIAKEKFMFVIAHRAKPTYVALLATKLPVISVHHNYNDFTRWSRRPLVNFYKSRMLMLGVSDSVRDDLRRDLKNWPAERIQTLYNRIDVAATQGIMLNKAEARTALNLPQKAYVIGNVGRLHHDKDQTTLIKGFAQALPQLPANSVLFIAGKGPLEQNLKQLVSRLKLESSVIFAGNVPDAKRYFKVFDVFVLTSDREPFGMVLLEAMVAGVPIICSDCGGGAEIVRDVGALFAFGNADALASCLANQYLKTQDFNGARAQERLNTTFSDQSVKNHFWNMTFIKAIKND